MAFRWRADASSTLNAGWVALCFSRGSSLRKQPIIALYFESENELKFYNLKASISKLTFRLDIFQGVGVEGVCVWGGGVSTSIPKETFSFEICLVGGRSRPPFPASGSAHAFFFNKLHIIIIFDYQGTRSFVGH